MVLTTPGRELLVVPACKPCVPRGAGSSQASTARAFARRCFETKMKGAMARPMVLLFGSANRGLCCFYLYACWLQDTKNYLINPSPCLASQAGWRLPMRFCTEDDKLLQDNGSGSSSHFTQCRMRPVSPQWAQPKGCSEDTNTRWCPPSQG